MKKISHRRRAFIDTLTKELIFLAKGITKDVATIKGVEEATLDSWKTFETSTFDMVAFIEVSESLPKGAIPRENRELYYFGSKSENEKLAKSIKDIIVKSGGSIERFFYPGEVEFNGKIYHRSNEIKVRFSLASTILKKTARVKIMKIAKIINKIAYSSWIHLTSNPTDREWNKAMGALNKIVNTKVYHKELGNVLVTEDHIGNLLESIGNMKASLEELWSAAEVSEKRVAIRGVVQELDDMERVLVSEKRDAHNIFTDVARNFAEMMRSLDKLE